MASLPQQRDERLIVGFQRADDAGVVRLPDGTCLVQTVDFLTPIADDPYTYGVIAATNALSDVWAMGGEPVSALNILCWPDGDIEEEALSRILEGGQAAIHAAGAVLAGGHSVRDRELKYGLAVTGVVDEERIWTNAGAQAGAALLLTKPLGTGIISTAVKRDACPPESEEAALTSMQVMNRDARDAATALTVHSCTDITGNGLAGHAWEMALASGVALHFEMEKLPLLPGVAALAEAGHVPGGAKANASFVGDHLHWHLADEALRDVVVDPQTSGGLLFCLPTPDAEELRRQGIGVIVGRTETGPPGVHFH